MKERVSVRRVWRSAVLPMAVAGAVVGAGVVASPASAQTYYVPVSGDLVVHGHGFGHGHGMSQYGAQGAALAGKSWKQIVSFYYPHTALAKSLGRIRVLITADTTSDVIVKWASGLSVRDLGDSKVFALPQTTGVNMWRISPRSADPSISGVQFHDANGWHHWRVPGRGFLIGDGQFTAARPLTLVLPDGSTRVYRGALRAASPWVGAPFRDTVDVLRLDDYVRGVVAAEMPSSWSPAALQAQAVAARTYAAFERRQSLHHYYQICDTTSCQVYAGVAAETTATNDAVAATAGQIVTYNGNPAFTQFASSDGGWTSDGGQPYLIAQRDPYDGWSGNPVHNWQLTISVSALESAYPQLGNLTAVRVTKRDGHGQWGGRVVQMTLQGSRGTVQLTGDDLRYMFGLRSSWFSFSQTPIMRAWLKLGGSKSPLGNPASGEVPVTSSSGTPGAMQLFARGQMFWTQSIGAQAVYGPILPRWRRAGGIHGRLGYPTSDIMATADGGQKARFQGGMVFYSSKTPAQPLWGPILRSYANHHFAGSRLGYPTTKVYIIDGGLRARFEGGRITWMTATRTITVDFSK
ncbi:MAG: SpoIID/LytB domain-containing protein [Nocardioidaceae bacterium]